MQDRLAQQGPAGVEVVIRLLRPELPVGVRQVDASFVATGGVGEKHLHAAFEVDAAGVPREACPGIDVCDVVQSPQLAEDDRPVRPQLDERPVGHLANQEKATRRLDREQVVAGRYGPKPLRLKCRQRLGRERRPQQRRPCRQGFG